MRLVASHELAFRELARRIGVAAQEFGSKEAVIFKGDEPFVMAQTGIKYNRLESENV